MTAFNTFLSRLPVVIGVAFASMAAASVEAATIRLASPDVITVQGDIELEDCARWMATIQPGTRTVFLSSPGGRAGQGECISRSIAARRLTTVVRGECDSICFLLFAAGARKEACQNAQIGVHRPHDAKTLMESDDPTYLHVILDYAGRYHVPRSIQEKLSATRSDRLYYLNKLDLAAMGVSVCTSMPSHYSTDATKNPIL